MLRKVKKTSKTGATKRQDAVGRMKDSPRYHVISLRISDEELSAIKTVREGSENISDFMRKVLASFIEDEIHGKREEYCYQEES